ncbi:MAG: hypothetical protein AMK75_04995 [Planctomycetes bacterium SM23_65]|nr:MAG: hypothetical protein AMK75_04995 [Planctomycetes bacterium SM23_65]
MDVRKTVWMIAAMVLGLIFAGSLEAARKPTRSGTTDTEKKSTWYIVVQVKDTKGEVSFEVIDAKNLTTRVKACREQYKEAVKEWNAARITAKKNKQTFTTKKPVEPYVRQVGSRFKSEAKAKEYAEKLRQLYEARKAKKAAKSTEPKNTAPAPDTNKEEE